MKVKLYVWAAWVLLVGSIVGWPLTALTIFADEPPGILGLSWLAIIITCWGIIVTTDVREKQEHGGD